jgi:Fe-S cluster assembly protein SufD
MTTLDTYAERLEGLELLHRGPAWLRRLRETSWASLQAQGFPTKKHEDWKYTSTRALEETAWELPTAQDPSLVPSADAPDGVDCVFIGESTLEASKDLLGTIAHGGGAPFVALNNAFFHGGVAIRVPAGETLEQPIHVGWRCGSDDAARELHPRTLVIVGAGARATLVEKWHSAGSKPYFVNTVTEIVLEEGAHLDHVIVQSHDEERGHHVQTVAVRAGAGAQYHGWGAWLGARLSRCDLNVGFNGEGGWCRLDGAFVAGAGQHIDVHSAIDHIVPSCTSRQLYKGVLGGDGHGVFNGKVVMREGAQGSDTEQANHNLLLSEDAEIDTKPQLEIFADDVKASHGTTVGQLDDEQLFYLRSRGIPQEEASRMITRAFAAEAFAEVPDDAVREDLLKWVQADLDRLLQEAS